MILIAPDKFKGYYTAAEVCEAVVARLRAAGYRGDVLCRPMSDGGEGAADMLLPHGRRGGDTPGIYFDKDTGRCVAVSSEIVGFAAFEGSGLPLMRRSSFALGRAIPRDVPVYVAVGGTAVADGGAGFLQGLGVIFYDRSGSQIREPLCPATLHTVADADTSALSHYRLTGVVDVEASLIPQQGDQGLSALDFAPQKALPGEDLGGLAEALRHLHDVLGGRSPWDGAGGGLGYAIASVVGGPCVSGARMAAESLDVGDADIDLVITGEGRVDMQTSRGGKLVDAVYRRMAARGIPVLVLYGAPDSENLYPWMAPLDSDWIARIRDILPF